MIDRVVRARDGALEIHDFKTAQRVPSQQVLDRDRQLALYQIGVAEKYGADQPIRLVWHYLLRDQVRTSTRTPEALDDLREHTIQLIDAIRSRAQLRAAPERAVRLVRVRRDLSRERPPARPRARSPPRPPAPGPDPAPAALAGSRFPPLACRGMGLRIERIPTLGDNYTYLLVCEATGEAAVVDAPEAGPVIQRVDGARRARDEDPLDAPPRRPLGREPRAREAL